MSSGRSVAFAGVVLLFASGAIVAMALSVNEPQPVDARRVDLNPVVPGVLSASYTTTLQVARRTTTALAIAPPAPRPAPPPVATTAVTTTEPASPPPSTTTVPESTSSTRPPWDDNCDRSYVTDGICVPRYFPPDVWRKCDWMYEQGVTRIEVVGWDRHHLDRDRDGVACERAD